MPTFSANFLPGTKVNIKAGTGSVSGQGVIKALKFYEDDVVKYDVEVYTGLNDATILIQDLPASLFAGIPQAVTNVAVSNITSTGVTVTWDDIDGEANYYVEHKTHAGSTWTRSTSIAANTLTKAITGLTTATNYDFRVVSVVDGSETNSATVQATTA